MRFETGMLVVHPVYGVCKVEHIGPVDVKLDKSQRSFYRLAPVYDSKSTLYVHVEVENFYLRPVMTRQSAEELVSQIPTMEPDKITNEKEREKIFKEMLHTGDHRDTIRVIKTIYKRRQDRMRAGKKNMSMDEKYLGIARDRLNGELAVALGIEKSGVDAYISDMLEK
ncbi:MAG: CarD family transcriptional regulator [Lachnospiraceae bacterium]|nr:CarD family transcriptional regulator [Lachnospiraceae bacterium]